MSSKRKRKRRRRIPEELNFELECLIPKDTIEDKDKFARLVARVGELAVHEFAVRDSLLPIRFAQFPFEGETYTAIYKFEEGKAYLWHGAHADRLRVTAPYN